MLSLKCGIYKKMIQANLLTKQKQTQTWITNVRRSHRTTYVRQKKQILYINAYMWNLEKWYRWSYLQNRKGDTEIKHMDNQRGRGGGTHGETGTDTRTLLRTKQMKRAECAGPRALLSALWRPRREGNPKKRGCVCMHSWFTMLYSRN